MTCIILYYLITESIVSSKAPARCGRKPSTYSEKLERRARYDYNRYWTLDDV